jgi:hypothetical protein
MTPPPVASPSLERAPSGAAASSNPSSSARATPRARAAERPTAVTQMLECVWCVGRGGELLLRLALPVEHGARAIGELSFSPASASTEDPAIATRETLVSSIRREWRLEARKIGEGEYELALAEIGAPSATCVEATLATMLRANANAGDPMVDRTVAEMAPVLVLTSLPSAIGLRGGTYVLRRSLLTAQG